MENQSTAEVLFGTRKDRKKAARKVTSALLFAIIGAIIGASALNIITNMCYIIYNMDGVSPCDKRPAECKANCVCESKPKQTPCLRKVTGTCRPKWERLYRTNSLAKELRKLGIPFTFFGRDTIQISIDGVRSISHHEIFIAADYDQYEVTKHFFKFNSHVFEEKIYSVDSNGKDLLSVLVFLGELPERFQPEGGEVIL